MSSKTKTTAGKEEAMPALVPKLRFPKFRGAEGWTRHPLRELTTHVLDGDWIESKDQADSGFRLIQTGNIGVGVFIAKSGKSRYISEDTFNRLKCTEVFPGDCLISRLPDPAGRSCFLPDIGQRMITAVDCTILRFKVNEIVPEIFLAYSQTDGYFREIAALSSGSTRQRVSRENLSNIVLVLPKLPEQQKIAECLSSVDELMAAQARKVDALKTHKKGLMQQLFPREGETQPCLRFPEFQSAKAWQSQKISNLLRKVSDSVTVEPDGVYREIGIRSHGKGIFHKELVSGKKIGSKRVFSVVKDAFVVNIVFAWEQAVATTSIAEEGMIASHRFPMYVALAGRCHVNYMKYFFLTNTGKYLLGLASPGGAGRNRTLGQKEFEQLEIVLPQKVDEQMRVADCLSSIDTLITLETQKLEALKTHKKGLMQQLFPSPEEVA